MLETYLSVYVDRKLERQAVKQTNIQTDKHSNRQTYRSTESWRDWSTDRYTESWREKDRQTNRWTDRKEEKQKDIKAGRQTNSRATLQSIQSWWLDGDKSDFKTCLSPAILRVWAKKEMMEVSSTIKISQVSAVLLHRRPKEDNKSNFSCHPYFASPETKKTNKVLFVVTLILLHRRPKIQPK
jgi:hypothetical protein